MISDQNLFSSENADERSLGFLVQAIEKNNLPGFDYFEFRRAVLSLRQMDLEDEKAFKSAFATASTLGITKDKLLETASYYRHVVEKEKEKFDQALENQNATKVKAREEEMSRLNDQIERHKAEISRLQDEVAEYLEQISTAEKNIELETQKISKAHESFEKTHKSVLLEIDADIENLHKFLQ